MMFTFIKWNPDPEIFNIGFFALRWYSVLFLAGFVVSYQLLKRQFLREQATTGLLEKLTIYVVAGTVIGARLGHCLFYDFAYYKDHIMEIFLPFSFYPKFKFTGYQGLASHGGAIGILLSIWLFSRRQKVSYLWTLDQLAPVVPLAGAFIRLGNLMNSEIIGKSATVKWAFIFVREDNLPRHPAQLYEAFAYLLIFILIQFIRRHYPGQNGYLFGWLLTLVFSARFLIEFYKENQSAFESGLLLNMGQILSIPLVITGIIFLILKSGPNRSPAPKA